MAKLVCELVRETYDASAGCALAQGAVGSMPWYSMSFLTLYFESLGLSHGAAAGTRALLDAGAVAGNLLGGVGADDRGARGARLGLLGRGGRRQLAVVESGGRHDDGVDGRL